MSTISQQLQEMTAKAVNELYDLDVTADKVMINLTRKEFEGNYTVVIFPFVKAAKKSPDMVGQELGDKLIASGNLATQYNVVKGFLNLTINENIWLDFLKEESSNAEFGKQAPTGETIVIEYCGPNTNKPLHLGHIRNMLLGYSVAEILAFNGNDVHKVNIYNDRGIAICKSMLAWQKFGNGETPESSGMKGDHLAGKYYVEFDKQYKTQVAELIATGKSEDEAKEQAPLMQEAREMLLKWEAGDEAVLSLWKKMNDWVYAGFEQTFAKLGVDFEKHYEESIYYLKGKALVQEGLDNGSFYTKEDGSTWVDLEDVKLDQKILLRSDGTSVYLTQDLGVAQERYNDYTMDRSIYVVANEQDYHFKVLRETLKKLGKPYAEGIFHLSYGLVDLPSGRMKSREGTVVDADDLVQEMIDTAEKATLELGKVDSLGDAEAKELYRKIGLGALKYFMLRVDPKKKMLFDPESSIDLQGDTGPFVQYAYARIQSLLSKAGDTTGDFPSTYAMAAAEKELTISLYQYPTVVKDAGDNLDPSAIASYVYELAKNYNKFYNECPILTADNDEQKALRLNLSRFTGQVIASGLRLLGIEVVDRM